MGLDETRIFEECHDPRTPGSIRIDIDEKPQTSYLAIAKAISGAAEHADAWLLITEYGIWPSRQNLHLYYALRRAYGDMRMLGEAPVHQFLSYERAELVTFLHLALLFGWGGRVITNPSWTSVTFSHDRWMVLSVEHGRDAIVKRFADIGVRLEVRASQRMQ